MENRELREALRVYNEDTLKLITSLENDDYDALDGVLNKRQKTIDDINKLSYTQVEFSEIAKELKILMYQKKLSELMIKKRDVIKGELNKISNAKNANNIYNKRMYNNTMIFNKMI